MQSEYMAPATADAAAAPLTGIEYRLLVEHSPVMIWRSRLDKKCDYFNHTWLEFTGRTMSQESGDGWTEGVHPEDLERCVDIYVSSFDLRRPFEMEYRLRRHDGVYRWIFDRGVPYTGDRGEFLGFVGSCVDVTERMEAEEHHRQLLAEQAAHAEAARRNAELEELNQRVRASEKELRVREQRERFFAEVSQVMAGHLEYSAALDAIADVLVPRVADFMFFDAVTSDGSIERLKWRHSDEARAAWLDRMKGTGFPTGPNHPAARVLRKRAPEFVPEVTEAWIRESATSPEHAEFLRGLGARSVLRLPLIDGDQLQGVLTLGTTEPGREFTERDLALGSNIAARLIAALRKARMYSELQQAVRIRDEVTSIVSHDLKDPVHTIQMAASVLLDPELGAAESTRQQHLTMIRRCATKMAHLLEDLLDVARAEASSLAVTPRPVQIASLIQEVVDDFRLSSAELGVALDARVAAGLPLVAADDRRIVQVLTNLCSNALKFTPRGGTVTVLAEPAENGVRVSVVDTGIGIPRDNLERVFDRFWQAKRASRASAGLGLSIAKSIVEAHGGRIWVESTEGTGTQFHFTLLTASP